MLIVFSGLPGVGKTSIARELAQTIGAVHLRIDSIEQALRRTGTRVDREGYDIAYAIAEDSPRVGRTVIADCVNPWPLTRQEWRSVAERTSVASLEVEIVAMRLNTGAASNRASRRTQATRFPPGRTSSSATTAPGIAIDSLWTQRRPTSPPVSA